MYQNIPTKVLTGEVRLSYVHLVTPQQPTQPGQDAKYTVTLLIPKSDTATFNDIQASMQAAYEAGVTGKWGGARPQFISVLHDGDGCRRDGTPFSDEYKGHWVITASSKTKPQVVGIDNINCELAPGDIYSGMYARVTINFYAYNSSGARGVACGLGNVLKIRDGEPLGGGASASSDFGGIGAAPQQYAPAPQQYAPTPQQYAPAPQQYAPTPQQYAPAQPGTATVDPITGRPIIK